MQPAAHRPVSNQETALLLIDVINDLDFDEGADLLRHALPMAEKLAVFKKRLKILEVPVVYVNDNFGHWRSDFRTLVARCLNNPVPGRAVVEKLQPEKDDLFVLKPKFSAFFSTTLEILLRQLDVRRLILTGMSGNVCVLFSAADAYMRGFDVIVPADCIACINPDDKTHVLGFMQTVLKADIRSSDQVMTQFNERWTS